MFEPTHLLVSRSRQTPVRLVSGKKGFQIVTEPEWEQGVEPAFEVRPKQGFFCKGVLVIGYSLEPINSVTDGVATDKATSKQSVAEPAKQA